MTRFLSDALGAHEPYFRRALMKLEAANGHPAADIRLSSDVMSLSRAKLSQLGLDPNDTTASELFESLIEKVKNDDKLLTKNLRSLAAQYVSAEADPVDGMITALKNLPDSKRCFSLKLARLRTILKITEPKKTAKLLGYRSIDSMLKHESPIHILAAAWLNESSAWHKKFLHEYKGLIPSDFEERNIVIISNKSDHWRQFAESVVLSRGSNIMALRELGALVILPLPKDTPPGAITASLSLALHELNEIRAISTYLKLVQVKPHFGNLVASLINQEPTLNSELLDRPMPWHLIQRYYATATQKFKDEIFEPYLALEDMVWHPIEESLSQIEPKLSFWKDASHCCLMHANKPVSFNIIDSALNLCNAKNFEERTSHYFQKSLMNELMLKYLNHEPVELSVTKEIQPKLVLQEASI